MIKDLTEGQSVLSDVVLMGISGTKCSISGNFKQRNVNSFDFLTT